MVVGIVGLGLIGGSFAKTYSKEGHKVLAMDKDRSILEFAKLYGAVDEELNDDNICTCDLILICIYPHGIIQYLKEHGDKIGDKPLVIDCCGTKRGICEDCFKIAREKHFTYMGGHPMAGLHTSGFKYANSTMYHGAPMVLVPEDRNDIELLGRARELLSPVGFGKYTVTSAKEHDRVIAFTSQLAHVVSNAYVKSPTAGEHKGFSAGSYKDMTRVAWLEPGMWSELFLENKDYLISELDILIGNLEEYRQAMVDGDGERLKQLLLEGRDIKERVDGH